MGANNQTTSDGQYNYTYDDEGRRTRRTEIAGGAWTDYDWDHRGRLVSVTIRDSAGVAQTIVEYTYDLFDRKIARAETDVAGGTTDVEYYAHDGQHIAARLDADGQVQNRYLHGPLVDMVLADEQVTTAGAAGDVLWTLADNLGTIRDLASHDAATGTTTIANHRVFDAFGNVTSETNAAVDHLFGMTGRDFDEITDLRYHRARWFDANLGQWLSEDPIGFAAGDENLRRYVGNGATLATDPSGLVEAVDAFGYTRHHPHSETFSGREATEHGNAFQANRRAREQAERARATAERQAELNRVFQLRAQGQLKRSFTDQELLALPSLWERWYRGIEITEPERQRREAMRPKTALIDRIPTHRDIVGVAPTQTSEVTAVHEETLHQLYLSQRTWKSQREEASIQSFREGAALSIRAFAVSVGSRFGYAVQAGAGVTEVGSGIILWVPSFGSSAYLIVDGGFRYVEGIDGMLHHQMRNAVNKCTGLQFENLNVLRTGLLIHSERITSSELPGIIAYEAAPMAIQLGSVARLVSMAQRGPRAALRIYTLTDNFEAIVKSERVWGQTEGSVYGLTSSSWWRGWVDKPVRDPGVLVFTDEAAKLFGPHPIRGPWSLLKRLFGQQKAAFGDIVFDMATASRHGNVLIIRSATIGTHQGQNTAWAIWRLRGSRFGIEPAFTLVIAEGGRRVYLYFSGGAE